MKFPFDIAAITRQIAHILSNILDVSVRAPLGFEIPLWVFVVLAVAVFLIILFPRHKD